MKSSVALFAGLAAALSFAACAYSTAPDASSEASSKAGPNAGDVAPDAGGYDDDAGGGETPDVGTATDAGATKTDASASTATDSGAAKADVGAPPPPPPPPRPVTPTFAAGELVVSEVLYNPSGSEPDEEWFEVTNKASSTRSLNGLLLSDGSGITYTIPATPTLDVAAGDYVVLARNKAVAVAAGVPAMKIIHEYSALTLANGSTGGLTIKKGSTSLASVPFGSWTGALNGESIQLKNVASPTTASSWCFSATSWGTGADMGTPGQAADCP